MATKGFESLTMNFNAALRGKYYDMTTLPAFLNCCVGNPQFVGGKIKVMNIPCSIDIETTSFLWHDIPCGTMYLCSICINGAVLMLRTWPDVVSAMSAIVDKFKITPARRIRFYSRNFAFEFQFMRRWFTWSEVYAREPRAVMSALTNDGIEFRCSYVLTNQKLEVSAKDLIEHKVAKLVGDLDYRLPRHTQTPISPTERQYAINDVLVDVSLIHDRIISDGGINRIPLTATGYARKLCRRKCLVDNPDKGSYMRLMAHLVMQCDEYMVAKMCFAGGFTHASPLSALTEQRDVASLDFVSAYPAGMCAEAEYPMSKGIKVDPRTITSRDQLLRMARTHAFIGVFEFSGLNSKVEYDYYLSEHKLIQPKNVDAFNGRVASCGHCTLALTHIDFEMVLKLYHVRRLRVLVLWKYRKDYLPKPYIDTVLTQYAKKTELKGVAGSEAEYMGAKRDTNCLYGMLVTAIDRPDIVYSNDEWQPPQPVDMGDKLDKYNESESRFYSYLWGIMVVAICRRNLWGAICECKEDYHYSDTDSVKITNYDDHKAYFDEYNADIDDKLKRMCDHYNIDFSRTRPRTIKGVEKPLGRWDLEEIYPRFKALNAKRYIYTDAAGELHVTIAGTGKKTTAEYLLYHFGSLDAVFANFDNNLTIVGECIDENGVSHGGTGKLTHIYNDCEYTAELTDYTGVTVEVHERSSIYLEPCDYTMTFTTAFLHFLSNTNRFARNVAKI